MTNNQKLTFYRPNIREIMTYVISGHMNFTQAIESLKSTIGDFENLMVEYFNKDKVLPIAAFAVDKLFPHHNASVKNGHEHGTVNKTLLKFQIARIKDSKVPVDIKLRAMAHLMGHAKVIFPQSRFVQENLAKSDIHSSKDRINKSMPGTMEHKIEPEQKYREIKLGRMKIFLRK